TRPASAGCTTRPIANRPPRCSWTRRASPPRTRAPPTSCTSSASASSRRACASIPPASRRRSTRWSSWATSRSPRRRPAGTWTPPTSIATARNLLVLHARPQRRGALRVDREALGVDDYPVVLLRAFHGDVAVEDVLQHPLGLPQQRVAVPTPARQLDAERVARAQLQRLQRGQGALPIRAAIGERARWRRRLPAQHPPARMLELMGHAQRADGLGE